MKLAAIFLPMLVCFVPFSAKAQGANDEKARILFDEGALHFENRDFEKAVVAFRKSYLLKPSWKLLFNIAQSEAAAKRYGLAISAFEKYLAEGGDEIDKQREKDVVEEINLLRARVGSVEIRAPEGALVIVDDIERGIAPLDVKLRVAASVDHHLVVRGEDSTFTYTFSVNGGDSIILNATGAEIVPEDAESGDVDNNDENGDGDDAVTTNAPEKKASPPSRIILQTKQAPLYPLKNDDADKKKIAIEMAKTRKLEMAGWIISGVGAASLLTGTILGAKALSINNDLQKKCKQDDFCRTNNSDRIDKQMNLANSSTFLFATGAVLLSGGVTMLLFSKWHRENLPQILSVSPVAQPGYGGAFVQARF
ncbi:MAG: tetratricopeptide repeat protein [Deltaproteobacteria bacterium]|nr:tetratricopeptide repeat protein [Deltaproteobacteria bacterium]